MSKQTGRGANLSGGGLADLLGGLLGGQAGGEGREGAGTGGIGDLLSRGKDLLR